MVRTYQSNSEAIRRRLSHPTIDADGHVNELSSLLFDYFKQVGGSRFVDRFATRSDTTLLGAGGGWYGRTVEERRENGLGFPVWWTFPTKNTLDRATSHIPRLVYERLDEMGIDFAILYTGAVNLNEIEDEELRRVTCRALNTYYADMYGEHADRIAPVAMIPMHTPQEAIEELEHAVNVLGFKVVLIPSFVRRPIPEVCREHPEYGIYAYSMDTFGIDSEYDYDPFWAKCVELKVAPSSHSIGMGWGSRRSTTNFMYNHIGHFAATGEALCKSLFIGGVTRRFPDLKFAFLEGGMGWASSLYCDLIGHWKRRTPRGLEEVDPANLDRELLMRFMAEYGNGKIRANLDGVRSQFSQQPPSPTELEDYRACKIERGEDIRDLFVPHFYFGCEGDDPLNVLAFNDRVNPYNARLNAIWGSDIGHWDVPDMKEVLAEAFEPVEDGLMTEENFRDFAFANAVRLYGELNPDFFKGTSVEADAAKVLQATR